MQKNNVAINNKNILLIQKIISIAIIPLSIYFLYIAYYKPVLVYTNLWASYITFVLFILILDKINHNKAVKLFLLFTFVFYIFGYYRGYTFDPKSSAIYSYISSAIMIIFVILYFTLPKYNEKIKGRCS